MKAKDSSKNNFGRCKRAIVFRNTEQEYTTMQVTA